MANRRSSEVNVPSGSEWIVQARLPPRQTQFTRALGHGRARLSRIATTGGELRNARLTELYDYLCAMLTTPPVLLKAAGAVSVHPSDEEIDAISKHPLVKDIQPNRRRQLVTK
ncbi:MAG: hypothetical protein FJW38_31200 [Acidobacteria bacterium]|nr:hypothetical protein [Acidobacteriota bacterium]